jgi:hypothetical protein
MGGGQSTSISSPSMRTLVCGGGRWWATRKAAKRSSSGEAVQEAQSVGFVPGALQPMELGPFGKVEEGAGDGRHRDAVADGAFLGIELTAVDLDPGAPRSDLASSRRGDVDLGTVPGQSPERRRTLVAEHRARPHRQHRRQPLAVFGQWSRSECVDVAVDGAQPPRREPPIQGSPSHADGGELGVGQQALLPRRQADNRPFPGGVSERFCHMWR